MEIVRHIPAMTQRSRTARRRGILAGRSGGEEHTVTAADGKGIGERIERGAADKEMEGSG
jgi:hypothetical protein